MYSVNSTLLSRARRGPSRQKNDSASKDMPEVEVNGKLAPADIHRTERHSDAADSPWSTLQQLFRSGSLVYRSLGKSTDLDNKDGKKEAGEMFVFNGRGALRNVIVRQEKTLSTYMYDSYIQLLQLPASLFAFYCVIVPMLTALPFTFLYCLDLKGFGAESWALLRGSSPQDGMAVVWNVYLYSLSLSTTFGGSRLNARSPFCVLVAILNTLVTQLMFVYLSSAVFARLSQPKQPVKIATVALLSDTAEAATEEKEAGAKERYKILVTRLVVTGPGSDLVEARMELLYTHVVKVPGRHPSPKTEALKLVCSEAASLRYGMLVRHVINKESPLYNACTYTQLAKADAHFQLTFIATERSSMQPVFASQLFFVCDSEVIWDAEFMDQVAGAGEMRTIDHEKLNMYRKDGKSYNHARAFM